MVQVTFEGVRLNTEPIVARKWLRRTLLEAETISKLSIRNSPPTGRTYLIGKGRRKHVASSPGKPPRIRSGNLWKSVKGELLNDFEGVLGTPVKYGKYLELGTRKMEARPYLVPALRKAIENNVDNFPVLQFVQFKKYKQVT